MFSIKMAHAFNPTHMSSILPAMKKIGVACILACLIFFPSATKAYTLNSVHGDLASCDTMTRGIFVIWWDKDFNYSARANLMLDSMLVFRNTCLNKLGMQDPLSAQNGYFSNIYIHTPGNPTDYFAANYPGWGNGVGGDVNGYPFMTLPNFVLDPNYAGSSLGRWINLAHETFHIFQSHGMWDITPGIYLSDDGDWFVEASANWFAYIRYPNHTRSFIESEILVRMPHVPLWMAWWNRPASDPDNWQRQVHQYALSTYLYYLTNHAGITDSNLVSVFYSGTSLTPQEYLYNQVGGAAWRNHFIDCAAHMTNDFDFLLPAQRAAAQNEWNTYADPLDENQFIQTYTNSGSNGWVRPANALTTSAWSFNTYKLNNTNTQTYTFELDADATGSFGDNAYFQGKVVVQNSVTGASFHDLVMSNSTQGSLLVSLTPDDMTAYFIVAAMPAVFEDANPTFQVFPYQMRISTNPLASLETEMAPTQKFEIGRYNALGQEIDPNVGGLQFIRYDDGSTKKVYVLR
jgi:hypothetical protein